MFARNLLRYGLVLVYRSHRDRRDSVARSAPDGGAEKRLYPSEFDPAWPPVGNFFTFQDAPSWSLDWRIGHVLQFCYRSRGCDSEDSRARQDWGSRMGLAHFIGFVLRRGFLDAAEHRAGVFNEPFVAYPG